MVSLIHGQRQWFKSAQGHLIPETPRTESFCQYTILDDDQLVVEDASRDERFQELPAVTQMGIRFYAGAPITVEGQRVGTLCVLDTRPRSFELEDVEALADLAECVRSEMRLKGMLEVEREAHAGLKPEKKSEAIDPVTRAWGSDLTRSLLGQIRGRGRGATVLLVELGRLESYRESLGPDAASVLRRAAADRLRGSSQHDFSLGSLDESRFLLMFPELSRDKSEAEGRSILTRLGLHRVAHEGKSMALETWAGLAREASSEESDESLLGRAEKALERARKGEPGTLARAF